jgi:hypothetical protein
MALGSTQPLIEICTGIFLEGERRTAHKTDRPIAICEPIVLKQMREARRLTNFTVCYRNSFTVLTQKVLLPTETILQGAKEFQYAQFHFISCFKMIGHGNPNNNLELHSIIKNLAIYF